MIGPDATITLDFALARLVGVIDKMVVHPDTMQANLNKLHGLVFSQRVLLALTQAGMSREDAYRTVQRHAMDAWKGNGEFLDLLKTDPEVARHLDDATLTGLFDMGYHSKHVDTVFIRVFGEA
jgi:adenylosuccinate lyase